jgi:uncharacterized protein YjbI with pentapeptide repeats
MVGLSVIGILLATQMIQAANDKEKSAATLSSLSSVKFFKQKLQCFGCDLSNVNLSHYDPSALIKTPNSMQSCVMDISLPGANLSHVQMDKATFIACGRAGTVTPFKQINFSNVNLTQANLSDSTFYAVDFSGADFQQADLSHAKLSLSNFSKANFSEANLHYVQSRRDAMQGWGANFKQVNFAKADLTDASLYGFFQGANFTGADLTDAVLNSTLDTVPAGIGRVKSAELFKGVNFTDANLQGAFILSDDSDNDDFTAAQKADLSQAILCRTIMPDGSSSNRDC